MAHLKKCYFAMRHNNYYGHEGSHKTGALRKKYGSCMNRTLIVELLTLRLIFNVMVQLRMYTITKKSTLRVVFLSIYIFIRLNVSLLKVCHFQRYTSASDTPFACVSLIEVCHFQRYTFPSDAYIITQSVLFLTIHFPHRYTYPS